MLAHAQPLRDLGNAVASAQDLIDRLDLEFLGVSLRAHRTSCLTSSLRLTGVYWGRGDSDNGEIPTFEVFAGDES
ncbi:hypothetical protein MAFF211471_29730 [Ralstonia solanacearum]|nr:hypothetical protein MAFF211471_29730 [Ralstonia solanacearum]BCN00445.1 hypothetical protein RPSA_29810 [Ralstonia solanacearum]